ncbi:MAG TPA: BON domain-containing protein [Burkholderiaceae bacterium]|nr:BON domain-containing protein [Burkholderiaceae bacterium]
MKLMDKQLLGTLSLAMAALSGCAPLVIGAVAAGTAIVATDRRSTGTQLDDKTIQVRVANELEDALRGNDIHINVNSFERRVLLTGEVNSEEVKARAGLVATASKEVRVVNNELVVAKPSTFGERTEDNTLGARVRAAFVNTREIGFNSIDIVTDRRTIYLMGAVTQKEADVAAHVASRVPGVKQVVKLFDVASAEEINRGRAVSASPAVQPSTSTAPVTTTPVTTSPAPVR